MPEEEFEGAFGEILARERIEQYRMDYLSTKYIVGLDLGQSADYTAVCVIRIHVHTKLQVVHLERLPLGTPYPAIVRHIKSLLNNPRLRGNSTLVVDYTGCGRPVVDMIRDQGLSCEAVSITSGGKVHQETDAKGRLLHNYMVPKVDLVSILQVLMQNKKLSIAKGLKDGETLARELKSFKAKISASGHTSYEAGTSWREEGNDDLVLSVALACWYATKKEHPKMNLHMVKVLRSMQSFH